ncbi:hypothetical protein [Streptomyces sp. STR69]|uniref:hypothetical protein n=1 Tax=Streptomyces sp. STR69 TaxID=1796942 RepID=UPI00396728F4
MPSRQRIRLLFTLRCFPEACAGLCYGVSLVAGQVETVDINAGADDGLLNVVWARNTSDNVNATATATATKHSVTKAGVHRLRFWTVDPTVVRQELVIHTGGALPGAVGEPAGVAEGPQWACRVCRVCRASWAFRHREAGVLAGGETGCGEGDRGVHRARHARGGARGIGGPRPGSSGPRVVRCPPDSSGRWIRGGARRAPTNARACVS